MILLMNLCLVGDTGPETFQILSASFATYVIVQKYVYTIDIRYIVI